MAVTGVRFYASGTSELVRGCGASEGVVLALVLWRRERTPALEDTDQPKPGGALLAPRVKRAHRHHRRRTWCI
jgi:hypothetical protein